MIPLIQDKSVEILLKNKLLQIDKVICNLETKNDHLGVLNGKGGLILYHAYMSRYRNPQKHLNHITRLINEAVENVNSGYSQFSFCSGISGFAWTLLQLEKIKILKNDEIVFLKEIDNYLISRMNGCLSEKYYDYLHGAIGIGMYFLKKSMIDDYYKNTVSDLIEKLEIISINNTENYTYWETEIDKEKNLTGVNLSLSHGISSIIIFLCDVYNSGIQIEKTEKLVRLSVQFLLTQRRDIHNYDSIFPSTNYDLLSEDKSRLAWCYGDIGNGLALYKASNTFDRKDWNEVALNILLHSSKRRDLMTESIYDAGFCHGTSGLLYIFKKLYNETKREEFKEAMNFWLNETMKMAYHEKGFAGYKVWMGEKYGGWKPDSSLLEGISGIGLVFLSFLIPFSDWDECLLLSELNFN